MDISLVAKMKKYDEFISCYNEGDEKKVYKGKSLLFYSLSNNDTESRYLITDFLLNKGTEANILTVTYENVMTDGKQAFLDAKLFLRKLKRYRTVRTVLREDGG